MIESHKNRDLEEKIDQYVNGQLSSDEIDELWAELIQNGDQLDYLKTVANTKAVIESEREGAATILGIDRAWSYAAAAVVVLLVSVLAVINMPEFQSAETVEPITSIELDYYRSEDGVMEPNSEQGVLKDALALANRGNTADAIQMLEQELESADDPAWSAKLHLNIGSLYYNDGSYDQAIRNFQHVVEKQAVDALTREKGYWYLGNAYFQLNQLDKARQAIQNAYELNGAYRRVAKHYLSALATE